MSVLLRFKNLSRRFGRLRVLDRVEGEVRSGNILTIEGGNGSGKSTLLRCLAGLVRAQTGSIELEVRGRTVDRSEHRRHFGWVAPDLELYDELTVEENLRFFARLRRTDGNPSVERARAYGLPSSRRAGALSSGMKQRLRWAWALQGDPELLLLDEPFQNLDDTGETQIRHELADFLNDDGAAIVASPIPLELPHVRSSLVLDR